MAIAIQVENLSKQYRLGKIGTGTFAHDFNRWWHTIRGREDPYLKIGETNDRAKTGDSDYVWSLQDINFTINQGDAVGIIGRNGAGKSTLLKILSRVTTPTNGSIKIKGRVASLLEVGTGFHPELTGRENIYLNGAILGMRKYEIKKHFDAIVDFSGVERYIDTPVKRYSSGMYVRLAFAVAAYLESEILIVDEVLAVGDAEFQKKCLGKMNEVSKSEGRTVLFVSHNMASIKNLCTQGLLLKNGLLINNTNIDSAIENYLKYNKEDYNIPLANRTDRIGNQKIKYNKVVLRDENYEKVSLFQNGKMCFIELVFEQNHNEAFLKNVHFSIGINNILGERILLLSTDLLDGNFAVVNKNAKSVFIKINNLPLKSGTYTYNLDCRINNESVDWIKLAGEFNVEEGDFYNSGKVLPANQGYIMVSHDIILNELTTKNLPHE